MELALGLDIMVEVVAAAATEGEEDNDFVLQRHSGQEISRAGSLLPSSTLTVTELA